MFSTLNIVQAADLLKYFCVSSVTLLTKQYLEILPKIYACRVGKKDILLIVNDIPKLSNSGRQNKNVGILDAEFDRINFQIQI
jgi:hypothetical protein